jgi:hypothetical protein
MLRPYYTREYSGFVRHLVAKEPDYETAMALAVGGRTMKRAYAFEQSVCT